MKQYFIYIVVGLLAMSCSGYLDVRPENSTTFNNYFKIHLNNKLMIWELDTLYSDEVEEREHITLDFVGRIIQVTVGKVQSPPPWEEVISKWGS